MDDLSFTSASKLVDALDRRRVSAFELLESQLTCIARHNPRLNAIVTLNADAARATDDRV